MNDPSGRVPEREVGEFGVETGAGTLRLERSLPGPIERVWDYLTRSELRGKWLAAGVMELRVGGKVELKFRLDELSADSTLPKDNPDCQVSGAVTRCDAPRVLAFTWNDGHGEISEVTFELTAKGQDVQLVVTHRRLTERPHRIGVATGWHTHLGILMDRLKGDAPRPFWQTKIRMEAEYIKRLGE